METYAGITYGEFFFLTKSISRKDYKIFNPSEIGWLGYGDHLAFLTQYFNVLVYKWK